MSGKNKEKKRDSGICSVLFIVKLLILGGVFIFGLNLGRKHSLDQPKQKISAKCKKYEKKLRINSEQEPCPHSEVSSVSLCPSYYSTNKSLHVLVLGGATAPTDIFSHLHHPTSPVQWSFYLTAQPNGEDADGQLIPKDSLWGAPVKNNRKKKKKKNKKDAVELPTLPPSPRYGSCKEIYLTRTGSFKNQPNKCVAVAVVQNGHESIVQQSHRTGFTALKTDQYTNDFPIDYSGEKKDYEMNLMKPFLEEYDALVSEFLKKMGSPIDEVTGQRKLAIVMVANEGVMDLLLNFLCSAEEINLNLKSIIVFVGDQKYIALVENMGANAIYSPALGSMPADAAKFYMDDTFARLMWFKTTSVYLALVAGFNVLFQDVDLVWLKDPFHYFLDLHYDLLFMDDGQISPRYTPFYVNSGFYFVQYNNRTLFLFEKMIKCGASEIQRTHSHQQVLIRHISEAHHLYGLSVYLLDMDQFPSGQRYHENKPFIRRIQAREFRPYVFHMCWTENRVDKVIYFKDVGLWYLPDADSRPNGPTCNVGSNMLSYATSSSGERVNIREKCCLRERYWPTDETVQAKKNVPKAVKEEDTVEPVHREKEDSHKKELQEEEEVEEKSESKEEEEEVFPEKTEEEIEAEAEAEAYGKDGEGGGERAEGSAGKEEDGERRSKGKGSRSKSSGRRKGGD